MRVLLTSHGSTGDIFPVIALGKALQQAGHAVTFASAPFFRDEIERSGLEFLYLPPDWGQEEFNESVKRLTRARHPLRQLEIIYEEAQPFMAEFLDRIEAALPDFDLMVGSYLFPQLRIIAEKHGKPFAVATFCHNVVPSLDYPPNIAPAFSWLPKTLRQGWNRLLWHLCNVAIDHVINRQCRNLLESRQLPPLHGFCHHPADLALVAVSPGLMKPSGHIDPAFVFTGYFRHQAAANMEELRRLDDFLEGQQAPLITFGSISTDHSHQKLKSFLDTWPRNRKLIIQSGWAALQGDGRPEVFTVGRQSHDELFQRASVIIHHGGAGTTASALASGKPQIIIPHIADQSFWGLQVVRLGCGLSFPEQKWPFHLTRLIHKIEQNPHYADSARRCAEILAKENGPDNAVKLLELFHEKHRTGR